MNATSQSSSIMSPCRLVVISIIVASTVMLLVLSTTHMWPTAPIQEHKMPEAAAAVREPALSCLQGVVTTVPGGRLGNLAFEYATAAALARRYGLQLAVADSMRRQLSAAFGELAAPPLSRVLRGPPCSRHSLSEAHVLGNASFQQGTPTPLQEMVDWARNSRLPLVLKKYTMIPELITSYVKEIRQEFRFRPEIQRVADKKLADAKMEVAEQTGCNQSQVCTVGVHVRRSDYGEYMRKVYDLEKEAGAGYYKQAAVAMLGYLPPACAAAAFVVTSDDNKWCLRRLLPALSKGTAEKFPPSKVFLLSSEEAVDDLCLLASCQHSILSYGTFGTLAAVLAGGKVIMYDVTEHGVSRRPPYFRLADYLTGWSYIP